MKNYDLINPQRLVFAVARGARYQEAFPDRSYTLGHTVPDLAEEEWLNVSRHEAFYSVENRDKPYFRLRPQDQHLAYGSLSSALIQHATTISDFEDDQGYESIEDECFNCAAMLVASTWLIPGEEDLLSSSSDDEMSEFWLMAAEAMADEGF